MSPQFEHVRARPSRWPHGAGVRHYEDDAVGGIVDLPVVAVRGGAEP